MRSSAIPDKVYFKFYKRVVEDEEFAEDLFGWLFDRYWKAAASRQRIWAADPYLVTRAEPIRDPIEGALAIGY